MTATSTDYKIQLSLKTQGGTLINLPAEDETDAQAKLASVRNIAGDIVSTEQGLLGAHNAVGLVTVSQGNAAAPEPQVAPAQVPPQAPPPQAPPVTPAPSAPQCPHGTRVYKTGVSSRGAWSAWMCANKDAPDKCDPIWGN